MTTLALTFQVCFHTPFRVATGSARAGADASVDPLVPVPGSSVKGLMRAAARAVLGGTGPGSPRDVGGETIGDPALVNEVFGNDERDGGAADSPWHWDDVVVQSDAVDARRLRNRIRIEPATRTVADGALMVAEELPPTTAQFEVWRSGRVDVDRLPIHLAVLAVAGRLVDGLGGDRRAGTGWVSIAPTGSWAPDWATCTSLLLPGSPA